MDKRERGTISEGGIADILYIVGDIDSRKRGTALEGAGAYLTDAERYIMEVSEIQSLKADS